MKSSAKRIICIGVVAVVAVCAALLAHFFPGNSADGSADIVRVSVDENGIASFGSSRITTMRVLCSTERIRPSISCSHIDSPLP